MIGYMMKNSKGEYLAMDGGSTTNWFKASKFDKSGIEPRRNYLECGYELVEFEINERKSVTCTNKCHAEFNIALNKEGLIVKCGNCDEVISKISGKDESDVPLNIK